MVQDLTNIAPVIVQAPKVDMKRKQLHLKWKSAESGYGSTGDITCVIRNGNSPYCDDTGIHAPCKSRAKNMKGIKAENMMASIMGIQFGRCMQSGVMDQTSSLLPASAQKTTAAGSCTPPVEICPKEQRKLYFKSWRVLALIQRKLSSYPILNTLIKPIN